MTKFKLWPLTISMYYSRVQLKDWRKWK